MLNYFRNRNRPTQALLIFLVFVVLMNIINRKEKRTGNQIQKMKNRIKNDEKFLNVNPTVIGREIQYTRDGIAEAQSISMS